MNNADFERDIVDATFKRVKEIGATKGREYAGQDLDRLANFKRNGANLGLEPTTCWLVYAGKHWDSICTFMRDLQAGRADEKLLSEPIEGRLDDLLVYCLLAKGLIADWREKNEEAKLAR